MKKITLALLGGLLLGAASCSVPTGWSVDGVIAGAPEDVRPVLENYSNGRWLLLDSLSLNGDGAFSYKAPAAAAYTELVRLTVPGQGSLCFPVDSADNIIIDADYAALGRARVYGTPQAGAFVTVDSVIAAHGNSISDELRRDLAMMVTRDTTGIVAYYIVNKSIGNERIFDPAESFGNRIFGAAATVYATHRPSDPRGEVLRRAHFEGRAALGRIPQADSVATIEASETGILEIDLYDNTGERHKLSETAAANQVVVLDFTTYTAQNSPEYNAMLNGLYTRYHDRGMEIYQIALDSDEARWKEAAENLPWITVFPPFTGTESLLMSYLVTDLPTTFIIRNGEIVARIESADDLANQLQAIFR